MYDLNCPFDIEEHKKHYINYLEVIIFPDGHIEYAVPSHQEKLIKVCQEKYRVTREELSAMCPEDYYCDFMVWLCNMSECVSVWNDYIVQSDQKELTPEQKATIELLKREKLLKI